MGCFSRCCTPTPPPIDFARLAASAYGPPPPPGPKGERIGHPADFGRVNNDPRRGGHGSGGFAGSDHSQLGGFRESDNHGGNNHPFQQQEQNREEDEFVFGEAPQQQNNAPPQSPQSFGGNQQQAQPQFHPMPTIPNARQLRTGELIAHLQQGGQTQYGERVRGHQETAYAQTDRRAPEPSGGGGDGSRGSPTAAQPEHAWFPTTERYAAEQTRRRD